MEQYEHMDLHLRRQTATESSQMRTVGVYNIELCNGEVHSLVVLFGKVDELIWSVGSLVTGITAFASE